MSSDENGSMRDRVRSSATGRRVGVLVGGSGLVGGTLLHHFKSGDRGGIEILSPNSKELSLRVPEDVRSYFERVRADFIINAAIAGIYSDPQLTYEVNCLGAVYLARAARDLGIPYIHISSGAVMPMGTDLPEEARLGPSPEMANYARGKLLAELALEQLRESGGLDFTIIRLGIVYGSHDHKIQGFHRLLYSIVDGGMPVLLTRRESRHSYSNARKLPAFVRHVIEHRDEFAGKTFHFVDPEPVPLGKLILTVKELVGSRTPRKIYIPYRMARLGLAVLGRLARVVSRIGIEARAPAESVFLRNFYESQVLSSEKLRRSSFVDPDPEATIFKELPSLVAYYLPRWEHQNLIAHRGPAAREPEDVTEDFLESPEKLLATVVKEQEQPFLGRPGEPRGKEPTRTRSAAHEAAKP